MKDGYQQLVKYIRPVDERNRDLAISKLLGISITKQFIPSIANIVGTDLSNYKIVRLNYAHLYPSKQLEIIETIEKERN